MNLEIGNVILTNKQFHRISKLYLVQSVCFYFTAIWWKWICFCGPKDNPNHLNEQIAAAYSSSSHKQPLHCRWLSGPRPEDNKSTSFALLFFLKKKNQKSIRSGSLNSAESPVLFNGVSLNKSWKMQKYH